MSSIHEEQSDQPQLTRLTFRQKFWLFGVGLPVLLIIVLLALVVLLPRQLNPTEEKLIGRWQAVSPSFVKGTVIEFRKNDVVYGSEPWLWQADRSLLTTDMMTTRRADRSLVHRLRLRFNLPAKYEKWKIDALDEKELRIKHEVMADPLIFQRLDF